ncbi:hypothetical protein [Anaeromicropila herbilytica]|uniref:Uncharacterized protein n=1 Tax=Anaeromicropila herbilytica TaxID=2785025 RepID=A0A7R7EJL9_9FIRM|nr:hypothetical protein [Anaeromicropila herbilytica]BCN29964.1 hypothetical protein bsdtb5_12590 [Anaeromicropila herbilytica]
MASVFKKLISKELGESCYNKYFFSFQKRMASKNYNTKVFDNEEIFNDIYNRLKDKDILVLTKMLERLSDTMFLAMRITRTFIFALFFYLFACGFIIYEGLLPIITVVSLLVLSGCFIYKTYEFVVNKFCFIDAHIIIVYKAVLDMLIIKASKRM